VKAPRYNGSVVEVGPLARLLVAHHSGSHPALSRLINEVLPGLNQSMGALFSVMGRHLARALECKLIADRCEAWLDQLEPGQSVVAPPYRIPEAGRGVGLVEAPRGALGHWVEISGRTLQKYDCIVPTTWNCSPRDDRGRAGALEKALVGIPLQDDKSPIEALRIIHSYDPCLACAVH
jgi:Ni,Fe-hydrogenase I large subunit